MSSVSAELRLFDMLTMVCPERARVRCPVRLRVRTEKTDL